MKTHYLVPFLSIAVQNDPWAQAKATLSQLAGYHMAITKQHSVPATVLRVAVFDKNIEGSKSLVMFQNEQYKTQGQAAVNASGWGDCVGKYVVLALQEGVFEGFEELRSAARELKII